MRILFVTTDREDCGVREYGKTLMEFAVKADPGLVFQEWTNPNPMSIPHPDGYDIVHLNHVRGIFSVNSGMGEYLWSNGQIDFLHELGKAVIVTQHDSTENWATMMYYKLADFTAADALVVHEKVKGLTDSCPRAHFFPQGVLPAEQPRYSGNQFRVGSVGFPFPWKNYDLLCEASAEAGWGVVLIAPRATPVQIEKWRSLNERAEIYPEFLPRKEMVQILSGCDATAFLYRLVDFQGSGSSAAIRVGIAARKPVIAFPASINRQVKDLEGDNRILWALDKAGVVKRLHSCEDPDFSKAASEGIRQIAERDSWEEVGRRYARLYAEARCTANLEKMAI